MENLLDGVARLRTGFDGVPALAGERRELHPAGFPTRCKSALLTTSCKGKGPKDAVIRSYRSTAFSRLKRRHPSATRT
jgi:hypothetical protein